LTFHDTRDRVVAQIRKRLRNGELTERALARQIGISQPHVNNVLRGRRKLSPEVADLILNYFHCSLLDLFKEGELRANLNDRILDETAMDVEVLRRKIGLGQEWATLRDRRGRYSSPCATKTIPECLVLARLLPDARMSSVQCGSDMALLDISLAARLTDCPADIFVVCRGTDTLLRWIRSGFRTLYITDEQTTNRPQDWEHLPMRWDQRIEIVKARVVWMGKETSLRRA
jgi:transcriptional regulator with XRE-family HTH domain